MVLIHKLKQMEALDAAQFQHNDSAQPKSAQTKPPPPTHKRRPVLPARRPTTRSQTGTVTKLPDKELSAPAATRTLKRTADQNSSDSPNEKRQKRSITAPPQPSEPQSSTPVKSSEVTVAPEPTPDSTNQGPFISESEALDRRGPKSRAVLPIPVPNLTKKSRGRRVPTTTTASVQQETSTTRSYVCKVEHCGKCFNRGEHLKRHIRSIHTHEKPFECSHPDCDKFFNRHDNLLQHLKVHKDLPPSSSTPPVGPGPLQLNSRAATNNVFESSSPSPPASPPARASVLPQSYIAYPANGPYGAPSTSSFSRNMALAVSSLRTELPSLRAEVSSLRTEMPHSPPRERDENDRNHHNADADHRGGSFNSEGPRKSYYRLPPPIPRLQPTVTAMTHNWQL